MSLYRTSAWMVIAALGAALITGGIVYWVTRSDAHASPIVTVDEIKKIAQLATVEYHVHALIEETKAKEWYEWKEAKFLVFLKGKIKGLVDLKHADIDICNEPDQRMVVIKFKKNAVITSDPEIPPGGIRLITVSDPNIFHPITDDDRNKGMKHAKAEVKNTAKKDGIEIKTAQEAKVILSGFLNALGYDSQIVFEGLAMK